MADFCSTRSSALCANAYEAVLNGIAPDGGLYVPETFPHVAIDEVSSLSYSALAAKIIGAMLPSFTKEEISACADEAYNFHFDTPDVCPLKKVGDSYMLELFHGETAAFKDMALSILPRLMVRARRALGKKEKVLILTATSGDTGSAAMNGFRDVEGTGIITFYPYGGTSEIQRRQMVTMTGGNLTACAVKGNFDDCQSAVKRAFAHLAPPEGMIFSSANSINIARLVPQIAYYYAAYIRLVKDHGLKESTKVDFVVPTGNFGDILAGYYAKQMGLPVGRLVCASNANRVLTDFFRTGVYDRKREFKKTLSPSMDILISSNLERLLFHAENGNTDKVASLMKSLSETGAYTLDAEAMVRIGEDFRAYSFDDSQTLQAMKQTFDETGCLPDPHTAVGFACVREYKKEYPSNVCVVLSTASPFKFPQAAFRALGLSMPENEFDMLRTLSEKTGMKIPSQIARLETAPILHDHLTDPDGIFEFISEKAEKLCKV